MSDNLRSDNTIITVIHDVIAEGSSKRGESCLVMISGKHLGKKFALSKEHTLVGRSPNADIQLDEDAVSRNHALILCTDAQISIRDLDSTNGTYINDISLKEVKLKEGDLLKIGRTIFKFLTGNNIENAYHEEIYRMTTVDGLTQVFNKRYFLETLEREMSRALRYNRDLSLIMLDLDHFKAVNDNYGHLAGDFVLKQVAQHLQANIRRDDTLARYGGEEFAVVCPEINKSQAHAFAEKLRRLVEEQNFKFDNIQIPVTISMGIIDVATYRASLPPDTSVNDSINPSALIKGADEHLYKAKELGRNQVVS